MLTILKAINRKMINSEYLVPQDMRKGRVSCNYFYEMWSRFKIVTEANHRGAVCLLRITGALFVYSGVVLSIYQRLDLAHFKMLFQVLRQLLKKNQ